MPLCPCNSTKEFSQCCEPYLTGTLPAPTAEALMRSRYVAYARKDFAYVVRTWHEPNRPAIGDFDDQDSIEWTGLDVQATEAGGPEDQEGMVEFVATCEVDGALRRLHEKSSFVRLDDQWYYVDGEIVTPQPVRSAKIGRNEPCPCGSGKKYKKCCR